MLSDKSKVIDYPPIRNDYQYGMKLAEQGIGIEELSRDWPEVKANPACAAIVNTGSARAMPGPLGKTPT